MKKTALECVNEVEPNGELLTTDMAVAACEMYAQQFKKNNGEALIWLDSISALFPQAEFTLDISNRFNKIRELLK